MAPRTWVILGDKRGDNGQVQTIVEALGWPVEYKYVHMLPQYVLGKPRYRPSLEHLDMARSDPLEPPWPELIITVGRRPSMAALWVRRQSGKRTKIVLVGKPSGYMLDFSLVVASAENQMPPLANFLPTTLPLMRVEPADVAAEARAWRARFAPLRKPLIAILVGGQTNPFVMNRKVARKLAATARWVVEELGGMGMPLALYAATGPQFDRACPAFNMAVVSTRKFGSVEGNFSKAKRGILVTT